MTFTLFGRWQTRLLLLSTVGLLVTLIFGYFFNDFTTFLAILGYLLLIGFVWDILYNYLQTYRWDRDWPSPFQLGAGILEAVFLWGLMLVSDLPGIGAVTLSTFAAHYATIWLTTFLMSQGPLRIIFPDWRFDGGQWL